MSARAERRALLALAAIFALLVQVIAPPMAMAAPMMSPGSAICAPGMDGKAQAPTAPAPDQPAGQCGHCGHCVGATSAAALPTPIGEPAALVRYAQRAEPPRDAARRIPPARAPPRPPGQGPPASNA